MMNNKILSKIEMIIQYIIRLK